MDKALEFAKKILAYEKKAGLNAPTMFLLRPMTGESGEIAFVDRFASMSEYEEMRTNRLADSGRVAILKEVRESDSDFLISELCPLTTRCKHSPSP